VSPAPEMPADLSRPGETPIRPGLRPRALRLPALAGVIVFAVAVGTTQLALQITNREADRQLERLGQVYLDGIAASVRAGLEGREPVYVGGRFAQAFAEQRGIAERALFAFTPDGVLLARHGDPAISSEAAAAVPGEALQIDHAAGIAWIARRLDAAEVPAGRVVAALDAAPLLAARSRLAWQVVAMDLLLAGLFALATWAVLQRLGRPLGALVGELSAGARRVPGHLPEALVAAADPRSAAVLRAYNRMVDGLRERERLAAELAEQEQAAALGRLAATIAHEVRNPLGGLATAVSTLRRFGADPAVRAESLDFLDRGIGALDRIVTTTLGVYRPEEDRRLSRADLQDLALLARPAAEARGVALRILLDLPDGEVAPGAGGVRQVLLNLLLNACEATPPGGTVTLRARHEAGALLCEIEDEGGGLAAAQAARLAGAAPGTPERRLGLGVVVGLLGHLDARASVAERPGGGTAIRLAIPLGAEAAR
jgi:two-component system OmpR family sensor kinase